MTNIEAKANQCVSELKYIDAEERRAYNFAFVEGFNEALTQMHKLAVLQSDSHRFLRQVSAIKRWADSGYEAPFRFKGQHD